MFIKNFLKRVRNRVLDIRIELNLSVIDFCQSRVKTFERRKKNLNK